MPFELGLAVAWSEFNESEHTWFVFAADRGIEKSLSDLLGSDAYIHDINPGRLFRELFNALVRSHRRPSVQEMSACSEV